MVAEKPRKPRDNENSVERQVEDAICYLLDQEGTKYIRRKWAKYGAPDIVTDDAIYECKDYYSRLNVYSAIGQLMIYSTIYPNRRLVIAAFDGPNTRDLLKPVNALGFDIVILESPAFRDELWRSEGLLKGTRQVLAVRVHTLEAPVPLRFLESLKQQRTETAALTAPHGTAERG
jgi:hypothetical protein